MGDVPFIFNAYIIEYIKKYLIYLIKVLYNIIWYHDISENNTCVCKIAKVEGVTYEYRIKFRN